MDPRTLTVQELLWYTYSPVCSLSALWLCSRVHIPHLPGRLQPEYHGSPLLTHASTRDTQTLKGRFGSVSCGVPGSLCAQGFVWALRTSLMGIEFDSKHDFAPPTVYWGFSFVLGCGYLFWWDSTFSCWWLFSSYLQFGGFHRRRWAHILLLCHILGLFIINQNPFPLKKERK